MAVSRIETLAVLAGEPFKEEGRVTYKQFEKLVSERGLNLVGANKGVRKFLEGYILANHAGGEELDNFIEKKVARLPDSFFDSELAPESNLTIGDAMRIGRILSQKVNFSRNGNEPNQVES